MLPYGRFSYETWCRFNTILQQQRKLAGRSRSYIHAPSVHHGMPDAVETRQVGHGFIFKTSFILCASLRSGAQGECPIKSALDCSETWRHTYSTAESDKFYGSN